RAVERDRRDARARILLVEDDLLRRRDIDLSHVIELLGSRKGFVESGSGPVAVTTTGSWPYTAPTPSCQAKAVNARTMPGSNRCAAAVPGSAWVTRGGSNPRPRPRATGIGGACTPVTSYAPRRSLMAAPGRQASRSRSQSSSQRADTSRLARGS